MMLEPFINSSLDLTNGSEGPRLILETEVLGAPHMQKSLCLHATVQVRDLHLSRVVPRVHLCITQMRSDAATHLSSISVKPR